MNNQPCYTILKIPWHTPPITRWDHRALNNNTHTHARMHAHTHMHTHTHNKWITNYATQFWKQPTLAHTIHHTPSALLGMDTGGSENWSLLARAGNSNHRWRIASDSDGAQLGRWLSSLCRQWDHHQGLLDIHRWVQRRGVCGTGSPLVEK